MAEIFTSWSIGYSAGIATTEAVINADGKPICRMVDPSVDGALALVIAAPVLRKTLADIVQCIVLGNDPTEKGEDGLSLVARANLVLRSL